MSFQKDSKRKVRPAALSYMPATATTCGLAYLRGFSLISMVLGTRAPDPRGRVKGPSGGQRSQSKRQRSFGPQAGLTRMSAGAPFSVKAKLVRSCPMPSPVALMNASLRVQ